MSEETFQKEYQKLNSEQKKAVDTIEGPVMVVAGPGTGKTQVLTLRIANILRQTDVQPESILALTFTESGVFSMKKRLATLIGSSAYSVKITTFHGFCNDIIQDYPEYFPQIVGSTNITETTQISVLEKVVLDTKLKLLKPFGDTFLYVRHIKSAISNLKREGISPDEFEKIVKEEKKKFEKIPDLYYEKGAHQGKMRGKYNSQAKKIEKNLELSEVYKKYQEALRENKQYDYDDMIMETLNALNENNDLLLELQELYQYFLVDEHQDTNNAQNKILELLASFYEDNPNLFVVGDEKQSIFRFQGANLENFRYFKKKYLKAVLISLFHNYRSDQKILDIAENLIQGEKPLKSQMGGNLKNVNVFSFSKPEVEAYFLAHQIKSKIENGVSPSEIAVLYRDNRDAFIYTPMLDALGISYQIESDEDIFSDPDIKKLVILLRAVYQYGDDSALAEAMHLDTFKIDPLDVYNLLRKARQAKKKTLYDIISHLEEGDYENKDAILEFYSNLSSWKKKSHNLSLQDFIETLIRESGLLSSFLNHKNMAVKMNALDSFYGEIRSLFAENPNATLKDLFDYLDTISEHGLFIKKNKTYSKDHVVRLLTGHRSKGREFEYVYIINTVSGKWGDRKSRDMLPLISKIYSQTGESVETNQLDEERRLFYVALTRAKKEVYLTYSRENGEGREQMPSPFISEIKENMLNVVDTKSIEEDFEKNRGLIFEEKKKNLHDMKDLDFVNSLFEKYGLSVTALNNYLSCPWKYFYRNLIRIPEPLEPHLAFGSSVHKSLEFLFKKLRAEEDVKKEEVLQIFESSLESYPLGDHDKERFKERGMKSISGWFDEYSETWITNTLTELAISGIELSPGIYINGKLDKVEFLSDMDVRVVDYKTGKPKTRNYILGKTQNSEGDIFRQVVFYQLLMNLYKDGKYNMVEGTIDFVEPDEKGKYHKESFIVEDADVEDLKKQILDVAEEIKTLAFFDKRCDDQNCKYCNLREMLLN